MAVSKAIKEAMTGASWIRRMFEQGLELKKKYGEENVFDLTLGNPMIEPPESFRDALREAVNNPEPGMHRYMPNTGYPDTREAVANSLSKDLGLELTGDHVVMAVGAACALNVTLKSLLEPGDEVMVFAPYFPEYLFYAKNHGGVARIVQTLDNFQLDIEAVRASLNEKTKAIIVNSPNNPTGVIYPTKTYQDLARCLQEHEERTDRTVFVISDEPYRKIVYGGKRAPSPVQICKNSILCTSHSKDLGVPGERIGYAVVNPECEDATELLHAMAFCIRTLGFVNAPALMQRVVTRLQEESVAIDTYRRRRDRLFQMLEQAGYSCVLPEGAFYLFPKSPITDDKVFVAKLAEQRVLAVPGSGFGRPGYFRLSYCCDDRTIEGALPLIHKARKAL
jgi:aspartate aminotransferase